MRGQVVYFFAFDVANEIQVGRVRTLLGRDPERQEVRPKHAIPRDVTLSRPLVVNAPAESLRLLGQSIDLQAHVYEVGVVCAVVRTRVSVTTTGELRPFRDPRLDDGQSLDELAINLCSHVCRDLGAALIRPAQLSRPEGYTVFCLNELEPDLSVDAWFDRERKAVAALLSGLDAATLSESQVAETLRLRWSQEKNDLVIIDWDAALVVDTTSPVEDVLYVLEVANLQLEEFRHMDATLDKYLNQAYDDLERRTPLTLFGSKTKVLHKLRWFRIDLTKLADEITNITKFIGDWYLARIYLGARERFHLDRWRASVEQRFAQIDQLYSVVQSEVFERRMLFLELIMAVFFAIDLIAILLFKR